MLLSFLVYHVYNVAHKKFCVNESFVYKNDEN